MLDSNSVCLTCCLLYSEKTKGTEPSLSQIHQNRSGVRRRHKHATKTTPETMTRFEPMTAQTVTPINSQVL